MKFLLNNFLENYVSFDSKIFRTLKYLILKPGELSKEYLDGKRVSYAPPIRLYIILSILFFFLISVVDIPESDVADMGTVDNSSIAFSEENTIIPDTSDLIKEQLDTARITAGEGVNISINEEGEIVGLGLNFPSYKLVEMEYKGELEHSLDSATTGMNSFEAYLMRKITYAKMKGDGFDDILTNQISLIANTRHRKKIFFSILISTTGCPKKNRD